MSAKNDSNSQTVLGHGERAAPRPIADITSATTQRTIAKHARRLHQQLAEVRETGERYLEQEVVAANLNTKPSRSRLIKQHLSLRKISTRRFHLGASTSV